MVNMSKLRVLKRYYVDEEETSYQGIYIFCLDLNWFKFNLFTDCGHWFLYIVFGERWVRFSSAGFISKLK